MGAAPLRIAVLVKQIPLVEELRLGSDNRLVRDGALEMNAFCRRAVAKAVELAGERPDSTVSVLTLGPTTADDVLRESLAWGLDRSVDIRGVLVTDRAFAGSDTIATARALASVLRAEGPFDLVLSGRNSLDADTGQVPPQVAALLDLPFASGVKQLALVGDRLRLGCEHDNAWVEVELALPAVLSCAERLCEPAKVKPRGRAAVPAELIRRVEAAALGDGPWGTAGSLTAVGACREIIADRQRRRAADEPVATQVAKAVDYLIEAGALAPSAARTPPEVPATGGEGPVICVVAEPDNDELIAELCGLAARLASTVGGSTALLTHGMIDAATAGSWGADRLVSVEGAQVAEDVGTAVSTWLDDNPVWGVLVGSTAFGREVASRVAVSIGAGLTGDAVEVDVDDGQLVAWKPAFGGQLVAAITATSPVHVVTVRAGAIRRLTPRQHRAEAAQPIAVTPRGRVRVIGHRTEDSLAELSRAELVVGVGSAVRPDQLGELAELMALLGAESCCTRKVTDAGWMPHARQVGVTGRSIAPRLYIAIGTSGKFNHMAGVRSAGTVLAINSDPDAPVWQFSDVGIVAPWQECVPQLTAALRAALP